MRSMVRDLFRWRPGRRASGYHKMLLAHGSFWDCYLLRYPVGSRVPLHHDPVAGRRHFRLNFTLRGDADAVHLLGDPIARGRRWMLFRPDVVSHEVRDVARPRLVLSIGWTRAAQREPAAQP
jgi:hypothetical protein